MVTGRGARGKGRRSCLPSEAGDVAADPSSRVLCGSSPAHLLTLLFCVPVFVTSCADIPSGVLSSFLSTPAPPPPAGVLLVGCRYAGRGGRVPSRRPTRLATPVVAPAMTNVGSVDDAVRDTTGASVAAAAGDDARGYETAAAAAAVAAAAAAPPAVVMGVGDGGGQRCRIDCGCWDGCCGGRGCCCYGSDPAVRHDCLYAGSETCLGSCFAACVAGFAACCCCGE